MLNFFSKQEEKIKGGWANSEDDQWYEFTDQDGLVLFAMSNLCRLSNPCQHNIKINDVAQRGLWLGTKMCEYFDSNQIPIPSHFDYLKKQYEKDDFIKEIKADNLEKIKEKEESILSYLEILKISLRTNAEKIIDYLFEMNFKPTVPQFIDLCDVINVKNFQKLVEMGFDPFSKNEGYSLINTVMNAVKGNNSELVVYLLVELNYPIDTNLNTNPHSDAKYLINYAQDNKCNSEIIELILKLSKAKKTKYHPDFAYKFIKDNKWKELQDFIEDDVIDNVDIVVQRIFYKLKMKSQSYLPIVKYLKAKFPQYASLI